MKERRSLTIRFGNLIATLNPKIGTWKVTRENGGVFSLGEDAQKRWELSYQSYGKQRRKWFHAENLEAAIQVAERIVPGTGKAPRDQLIADVLGWWVTTSSGCRKIVTDYEESAERFIQWIVNRGVQRWSDMDWDHLQVYANELACDGKSKRTIEIYTYPIRRASAKAAAKWPQFFRDFAAAYSPPKATGRKKQTAKTLEQVGDLLLWLRDQPGGWKVLPGIALQGLCGLRVLEILRTRWNDLQLDHGRLFVTGRKGDDRHLPLPALVIRILSEAPLRGDRINSSFSEVTGWGHAVRRFMENHMKGSSIPPKDLRNTLATERRRRLWNKEIVDLYLGRKDRAVIDVNYTWLSDEELVPLFQVEVVSKVDELLVQHYDRWCGIADKVIKLPVR